MKRLIACLVLSALASVAPAQEIAVTPTTDQGIALSALLKKENDDRAKRLVDINAQRDAALPRLTAEEAGLAPLTLADILIELALKGGLRGEIERLSREALAASRAAAIDAVFAIKSKASDCAAKAEAAGLDPLVCK